MRGWATGVVVAWAVAGCADEAPITEASAESYQRVPCEPLAPLLVDTPLVDPLDAGADDDSLYVIDQIDDGFAVFVGDDQRLQWMPVIGSRDSEVGSVQLLVLHVDDGGPDGFTLARDVRAGRPRQMARAVGHWWPRHFDELLTVGESLVVHSPTAIDDEVFAFAELTPVVSHLAELSDGGFAVVVDDGQGDDALRLFLGALDQLEEWPVDHVLRGGDGATIDFFWGDELATLWFQADAAGPKGVSLHHGDAREAATWRLPSELDPTAAFSCLPP